MGASTRFVHRKATKPNVDRGLSFFDSGSFFDDGFGCGVGGQYLTPGNYSGTAIRRWLFWGGFIRAKRGRSDLAGEAQSLSRRLTADISPVRQPCLINQLIN